MSKTIQQTTVANMYTKGINNQLIHQRFDHRSMNNILEMKKGNMMKGLPANITKFHDEYKCPICLLTKATKMKHNKTVPSRLPHKKERYYAWIIPFRIHHPYDDSLHF